MSSLQVNEFSLLAISGLCILRFKNEGGGPFAYALCKALPGRISSAAIISGIGPVLEAGLF